MKLRAASVSGVYVLHFRQRIVAGERQRGAFALGVATFSTRSQEKIALQIAHATIDNVEVREEKMRYKCGVLSNFNSVVVTAIARTAYLDDDFSGLSRRVCGGGGRR